MSNDLISRSALICALKESGMIVDNDYGNAMTDFTSNAELIEEDDNIVTAWQPLPEVYKGCGDEQKGGKNETN